MFTVVNTLISKCATATQLGWHKYPRQTMRRGVLIYGGCSLRSAIANCAVEIQRGDVMLTMGTFK
jgi:hypothetical protein